jgi:DNA-binding XRE family transcriptional regulator
MTPAQCRAARGLLDWTQVKLAEAAGVGLTTVTSFERSWRCNYPDKIQAMQSALEAAGVEFFAENGSGAGVKFRKGKLN